MHDAADRRWQCLLHECQHWMRHSQPLFSTKYTHTVAAAMGDNIPWFLEDDEEEEGELLMLTLALSIKKESK